MEKILNSYETLFIIDATLADDAIAALRDKFTKLIADNGVIDDVNEWGKRRLAYPINDQNEGYYVLVNFKAAGTFPTELERIFGITEGIMRSIVIRHEDTKTAADVKIEAAADDVVAEEVKAETEEA